MYKPKYFTFYELIHSQTAQKSGIDNAPHTWEQVINLSRLAQHLDRVREMAGQPVRINSGFRSAQLNKMLAGSAAGSYHLAGRAADMACRDLGVLRDAALRYCGFSPVKGRTHYEDDHFELILYPTFVHLAIKD